TTTAPPVSPGPPIEAAWPMPRSTSNWPGTDTFRPTGELHRERIQCGPMTLNDVVVVCDDKALWSFSLANPGVSAHLESHLVNTLPPPRRRLRRGDAGRRALGARAAHAAHPLADARHRRRGREHVGRHARTGHPRERRPPDPPAAQTARRELELRRARSDE